MDDRVTVVLVQPIFAEKKANQWVVLMEAMEAVVVTSY